MGIGQYNQVLSSQFKTEQTTLAHFACGHLFEGLHKVIPRDLGGQNKPCGSLPSKTATVAMEEYTTLDN